MVSLREKIQQEIRANGPMSCARFMELALYHPEGGYYANGDRFLRTGREGDFFTSVSVGPLFGRLLAFRMEGWWRLMGKPSPFRLVEAGAMDGRLARDILTTIHRELPEFAKAVMYQVVEPLDSLKGLQQQTLCEWASVGWVTSLQELKPAEGVVFGNELLDAFPVHSVERTREGKWMERCVMEEAGRLNWGQCPCDDALLHGLPSNMRGAVEVGPGVQSWLKEASQVLSRGRMFFLDYGFSDEEYFQIERPDGTLRAYHQHQRVDDLLANPGNQDLTAHVRWTPLLECARDLGLGLEDWIDQGRWLTRILADFRVELSKDEIRPFQTLTHPQQMGAPFRVVVFSK